MKRGLRLLPLLGGLLLGACGADGVPLYPDGTPATYIESRDESVTISPSQNWVEPPRPSRY